MIIIIIVVMMIMMIVMVRGIAIMQMIITVTRHDSKFTKVRNVYL